MFKFPVKSAFVAAATAGLVIAGAGAASAGTYDGHEGDNTSIEDSGNIVLEDLVDANVEDVLNDNLSDNIVNDTLDVGDILSDNSVESDS